VDEQMLESNVTHPAGDELDTLYQQSLLHFQNGAWEKAAAGFEKVLRLRPDHAAAKAFLEETRLKAALDHDKPQPRRFRFRGATRPLLMFLLAASAIFLLLAGGRWIYSHWIKPQQTTQQVQTQKTQQVEQAFKYLADRDYVAAEQAFRTLLAEDPNNQQLQNGLQETQLRMALAESYTEAEAAIASQDWNEASRLLAAIMTQDPGYAEAGAKLAYVQEQQNLSATLDKADQAYLASDWQQAVAAYEALRNSNMDYQKETVTARLFDSYLQQGIHLVRTSRGSTDAVREAKTLYEKALALRPQQPQAVKELALADKYLEGQAQLVNGNLQAAQAALEWVCQQEPDYGDGNAAMLLRLSKGEAASAPTLAATVPTPAVATTPVPTSAVPTPGAPVAAEGDFQHRYAIAMQTGDAAFAAGNYAQAEDAYHQATAVAIHGGSDAARWLFVSYVKLGTTYAKRGNNEAAVPALKTALDVMSRSATAIPSTAYADHIQQGDSYAQKKDYANAFVEYDKAIQAIGQKCNCGLQDWSVVP
jgi:tetratricopeptide (TPR) repeat protein